RCRRVVGVDQQGNALFRLGHRDSRLRKDRVTVWSTTAFAAVACDDHRAPHRSETMTRERVPHLLIIGGGFAGLWATRALAGERIRITLVDRRNHHLFQPLLYQVATAGLSAPDIAAPLRHILGGQRNVEVRLGEVTGIDRQARRVQLADGISLDYDSLLLASGAT